MIQRMSRVAVAPLMVLLGGILAKAEIVGFEDFDGGAINLSSTTNVFDYDNGGGTLGDVFGRVSPGFAGGTGSPFDIADDSVGVGGVGYSGSTTIIADDDRGIAGNNTTAFFAMNDMDGFTDGEGNNVNDATWTFDISGASNPIASITMDLAAKGDFEAGSSDGFRVDARIGTGGFETIFLAITNEDASKEYRATDAGQVDTFNDPLELFIDGSTTSVGFLDKSDASTGLFDTYTSTLLAGQTGDTLDIRVSWAGTPSGSEPMGIDNITINAVTAIPEPGSLFGLSMLGLGMVATRRSRRKNA